MNEDPNIEPVDLSPSRDELIARVRARGRQIRARRRLAMSGIAGLIVAAIAVPAIALSSRSSTPARVTAAATSLPAQGVTTRIELPGDLTYAAGPEVHGTLVVDNETGAPWRYPTDANGCESNWAIVLTSADVPPDAVFPLECIGGVRTLPQGITRLPFTMLTHYYHCTNARPAPPDDVTCLPSGLAPPLPPGRYTAVLVGGEGWPPPHGVAVTLVPVEVAR